MREYYVVFTWATKHGTSGLGSEVISIEQIASETDINTVCELIKRDTDFTQVLIINWKAL